MYTNHSRRLRYAVALYARLGEHPSSLMNGLEASAPPHAKYLSKSISFPARPRLTGVLPAIP
jgi:hypothetical protein